MTGLWLQIFWSPYDLLVEGLSSFHLLYTAAILTTTHILRVGLFSFPFLIRFWLTKTGRCGF